MSKSAMRLLIAVMFVAGLLLPGTQAAFAKNAAEPTPVPTPAATVSSPEQPLAYSDQWTDLQGGEWHWYAFKYTYDDKEEQAPATIRLDVRPANAATLLLLNGEQVRAWEHGEKLQGFGAATVVTDKERVKEDLGAFCDANPSDPACNGDPDRSQSRCDNLHDPGSADTTCNYTLYPSRGYATWTGDIGASGTYYVLVRGKAGAAEPLQYKITVGGDGISMK